MGPVHVNLILCDDLPAMRDYVLRVLSCGSPSFTVAMPWSKIREVYMCNMALIFSRKLTLQIRGLPACRLGAQTKYIRLTDTPSAHNSRFVPQ
jgi:hypothetical protein